MLGTCPKSLEFRNPLTAKELPRNCHEWFAPWQVFIQLSQIMQTRFCQAPLGLKYLAAACVVAVVPVFLAACGGSDSPASAPAPAPPAVQAEPTPRSLTLQKIAGFAHTGGEASAEIPAFDPLSKRVFVVNGAQRTVDVLAMAANGSLTQVGTLTTALFGANLGGANGVTIHNGIAAIAVEASPKTSPGLVAFVRTQDLRVIGTVTVGALPDMLTFTPDGTQVLVANEGEPNSYGQAATQTQTASIDPEGSVSIISVVGATPTAATLTLSVSTADFTAFNSQIDSLRAAGVRIFGPGATVAQDLEPEYITVSPDGRTAYITLQENNALATLDIAAKRITGIRSLGLKDHNLPGMGLDASNEDAGTNTNSGSPTIAIKQQPIKGMYMPDALASFAIGSELFLVTANEGDAREYVGINAAGREDPRVREYCNLGMDPSVFGSTSTLAFDSNLGRLRMTALPNGGRNSKNAAGQCTEVLAFGARSISIWTPDVVRVWDSGDEFEVRTAAMHPTVTFNASNDNATFDDRSPAKGPEPEGVVIGKIGTKTFAFVGLERVSTVMVYDVSQPRAPVFVTSINTRSLQGTTAAGDRGPEGLSFVAAKDSPTGKPLLVVSFETSGTTAVFSVEQLF
jgi:DNA-binding beta-propeller fold protein YncE